MGLSSYIYLDDIQKLISYIPAYYESSTNFASGIKLTDSLPPVLTVKAVQVNADAIALNTITQSYLLSVQDSSSSLNNLDLTKVSNHSIELKPTDLSSSITVSGAEIVDVNLAGLSYLGATITKQAHVVNGITTGTDVILTEANTTQHMITLLGTNIPSSVLVYAPLNSMVIPATGVTGDLTNVLAADALADAANSAVTSVSVTDTASNINLHFNELINIFKAGKLVQIRASDNATLNIQMNAQEQLADISILSLITTPYSFEPIVTANDVANTVVNTSISHFTVTDTAEHISAHWSELESALTSGKLTSVSVSDGGIVTIPDLMVDTSNTTKFGDWDLSHWFSNFNQTSVDLLNIIDGMTAFNVLNTLDETSISRTNVIPNNLWDKLANLNISVPVHLLSVENTSKPFTLLYLSVSDLLALQNAIAQGVVADFNIIGKIGVDWCQHDFNNLSLITNTNILGGRIGSSQDTTALPERYVFTALEAHGLVSSVVYQAIKESRFLWYANYISDTALAINAYLDDIAFLLKSSPTLFTSSNPSDVINSVRLTDQLPPVLTVKAAQITTDEIALNRINQSYLLSVQDSSSSLNNLNLTNVSSHSIELKPTDLSSSITVSGAEIVDVNLAGLSYLGATITKQAHVVNGITTGTDVILTETNTTQHIITLLGTNIPSSVLVYAPLNSMIIPATGVTGDLTNVLAADALADAANSAVTSVSVTDTASNIELHFNDLM